MGVGNANNIVHYSPDPDTRSHRQSPVQETAYIIVTPTRSRPEDVTNIDYTKCHVHRRQNRILPSTSTMTLGLDTIEDTIALNDWNIVHIIRVRGQQGSFSARLIGILTCGQSPALFPLISTRPVAFSYSDNLLNTKTLILESSHRNRIAIRRAWGYLLTRKNSLHMQAQVAVANLLRLTAWTHNLAPYEENEHIVSTAEAGVLNPPFRFLDAWTLDQGLPRSVCCVLLILRLNNGKVEYYNPVNDTVGKYQGEDAIVLLECEESLGLLHQWDQAISSNLMEVDSDPDGPTPSSGVLKRKMQ
ncbi:hypothetical protein K449DRAFT_394849 [Hypoxylon sp. EC38]|nr:hypothetical protein K449DRAFT_394849 [Hypoxylon sp. EC38]